VVAFLTILGFSLYDPVVVCDKIIENTPSLGAERGDTYSAMVNRSMNQVLMRSINTTFVALLPVASLLVVGSGILGAVTLRDFALALFVGLAAGAYSSIFVAVPFLAWLKEREPRYVALRERAMAQRARSGSVAAPLHPAGEAPFERMPAPDAETAPGASPGPAAPATGGGITPRARRQRGRKRR
jgi:preprotein translocase subunit SecF